MIFVDTNVLMYAVGRPHPLRERARTFFAACNRDRTPLATSAETMQELAHAYLPAGRTATFDAALALIERCEIDVWPLTHEDVTLSRGSFTTGIPASTLAASAIWQVAGGAAWPT